GERFDADKTRITVEPRPFHRGPLPIVEEQAIVEVRRETIALLELRFEMKDGTGTRSAPALPHHRKFLRLAVRPVNESGLRGRQHFGARIVRAVVRRCSGIVLRTDLFRREIEMHISEIAPNEKRPAKISRLARLIDL